MQTAHNSHILVVGGGVTDFQIVQCKMVTLICWFKLFKVLGTHAHVFRCKNVTMLKCWLQKVVETHGHMCLSAPQVTKV